MRIFRTFTCISVVPVAGRIVSELSDGESRSTSTTLLVTIWELGEAAGPLLIAPLSEIYGRYPVMNACNMLFIAASLLAALSRSTSLFIVARALTGLAVASNVLNPAIIGDMFESDQRGSAMSLIMLAPLIGGAIGPAVSGAIAQTLGWRQVLFIAAGLAVSCEVLFLTCFRETYRMVILRRRWTRERSEMGKPLLDETAEHETGTKMWCSITRPATVLFSSGVLLALSLFGSVVFSYFYVMSTSLPDILQGIYGFSPATTGASFIFFSESIPIWWFLPLALTCRMASNHHIGIGSFISVFLCNSTLDRIYVHLRTTHDGIEKPEYRLPLSIIGGIALPFSVIVYGWIAQLHLPVPLLLFSVAFLGFTLLLTVIPLSAYVVDACGAYSASAMTGVIVTRCLMGTFLPLSTAPLAERFGYGWGFTILGLLSLSLAPIPAVICRYGEKLRQRSEFTRGI